MLAELHRKREVRAIRDGKCGPQDGGLGFPLPARVIRFRCPREITRTQRRRYGRALGWRLADRWTYVSEGRTIVVNTRAHALWKGTRLIRRR